MKEIDTMKIVKELVDFLLPDLTPYELSVYLLLLRKSHLEDRTSQVRIGKRTIARACGKGVRAGVINFEHVTKILQSLESKGCIEISDITREGSLYKVKLPHEIPSVLEKIATLKVVKSPTDYFNDPDRRRELFDRDNWACYYCGEKVTEENATLDHYIPISKGGDNSPDNLKTCCFICNSVKSGKTFEEAAPFILRRIQERKTSTPPSDKQSRRTRGQDK
jgi:5-methylcytosine-specific restriction endonuclease McrA